MAKANGVKRLIQTLVQHLHQLKEFAINSRESIEETRKTATVNSTGRVAIYTKVNTKMIYDRAMARCIGLMAIFIGDTGSKVSKTALDL